MSTGLFFRQVAALFWKNVLVASKRPLNIFLRCLLFPVGLAVFLSFTPSLLASRDNAGVGFPQSMVTLGSQFEGDTRLYWVDLTTSKTDPTPDAIMTRVTRGFSTKQQAAIQKLESLGDLDRRCVANFNYRSECYAGVIFKPGRQNKNTSVADYVIKTDSVLKVDVKFHRGHRETVIFPIQFAIDQAIIELKTGITVEPPREFSYTFDNGENQEKTNRLFLVGALNGFLALAWFLLFIDVAYHLPGAFAQERASGLTGLLRAMGLKDGARIVSWHLFTTLTFLPSWIIASIVWSSKLFIATNGGLLFAIHLLAGMSMASWSFVSSVPFGKSPQLAAAASAFGSLVFAIVAQVAFGESGTAAAFVYIVFFPSGFYIFALRIIARFEVAEMGVMANHPDPSRYPLTLAPLMAAAVIGIFLWPMVAVWIERSLYDVTGSSMGGWLCCRRRKPASVQPVPEGVAVSIRNLNKTFKPSIWRKRTVVAVENLSLDIPSNGIFVLLGSNGAGKSTTLSIVGGLSRASSGSILFEGGQDKPPPGSLGIVPQKNVLFPELTCLQTLKLWQAVKWNNATSSTEDLEQLLRDCDLGKKIHSNADTLSGGQKRKLQLAIGILANSKILLVDECTSGVDPLSRRSIWRTLNALRQDRTIIFTTHFLDEADLLADDIAILMNQGKLVASGSPVFLKSQHGHHAIHVKFEEPSNAATQSKALLRRIQEVESSWTLSSSSTPSEARYHFRSTSVASVTKTLQRLEAEQSSFGVASYEVLGTSIETIFIDLMDAEASSDAEEKARSDALQPRELVMLDLTTARPRSPLSQALTIFHKRVLVARRSWLTVLFTLAVGIAGSCLALSLLSRQGPPETCPQPSQEDPQTLDDGYAREFLPDAFEYYGMAGYPEARPYMTPPGVWQSFNSSANLTDLPDEASLIQNIQANHRKQYWGGVSYVAGGQSLFAWQAESSSGGSLLNMVTNLHYNAALNSTGGTSPSIIYATESTFDAITLGNRDQLFWAFVFATAMVLYPAFFSLYIARERHSSVQAMQLSNGLSNPLGLWLGHLMFDMGIVLFTVTLVAIIVAATSSAWVSNVGLLWLVMVLFGFASTLFSYCVGLLVKNAVSAFATVAAVNFVSLGAYLVGVMLTFTYALPSKTQSTLDAVHYVLSILFPSASLLRAIFVSGNLFFLACNNGPGHMSQFGSPILFLILLSFAYVAILVWVDSGSILPRKAPKNKTGSAGDGKLFDGTSSELLQVCGVSKTFGKNKAVDNVDLAVGAGEIFVLLGPNSGGKTTTLNMIRGDIVPDSGDVFVNGHSVLYQPQLARARLGVCPQFTAIDSQLTVRQHLMIYGRLKGIPRGAELHRNVQVIMDATALSVYADRLANKLSGGNQRKLALAIALLGNPAVLLIDEYSTGLDAKMKRDMWETLKSVSKGKALVITTHSMEEATALATQVGILAKKMLALGSAESLAVKHGAYEVHFSVRSREDIAKSQALMAYIPGARLADDVATRFEVPDVTSVSQLFTVLSEKNVDGLDYTVEKATLESVFIKVIRENNISEDDMDEKRAPWWRMGF